MISIYSDGNLIHTSAGIDKRFKATAAKLTNAPNTAGSLALTLPSINSYGDSITKLKSIVTVMKDGTEIWRGRVLTSEKDFFNNTKVYCEGMLAYLNDSIVRPYSVESMSASDYLNFIIGQHNAQVESGKQFQLSIDLGEGVPPVTVESNGYNSTLGELTSVIQGVYFSAYHDGNGNILRCSTTPGSQSGQVIQFGRNLLDLTEFIDASELFTILIPIGAGIGNGEYLTVESVNGGSDYIEDSTAVGIFGRIVKMVSFPSIDDANTLLSAGYDYLNQGIQLAVTINVKAVDLHDVGVDVGSINSGDSVRVRSVPHGLDTYFICTSKEEDLLDVSKSVFLFGKSMTTLTGSQLTREKEMASALTNSTRVIYNDINIIMDSVPIKILLHLVNVRITEPGTVNFEIQASGDNLSYNWQYSDDSGLTWTDNAPTSQSASGSTFSFYATRDIDGRRVRCKISDTNGNSLTSNTVDIRFILGG